MIKHNKFGENKSAFDDVSKNNELVDQSIDRLVQSACIKADKDEFGFRQDELEKTTRLLFFSSLIQNYPEGSFLQNLNLEK